MVKVKEGERGQDKAKAVKENRWTVYKSYHITADTDTAQIWSVVYTQVTS